MTWSLPAVRSLAAQGSLRAQETAGLMGSWLRRLCGATRPQDEPCWTLHHDGDTTSGPAVEPASQMVVDAQGRLLLQCRFDLPTADPVGVNVSLRDGATSLLLFDCCTATRGLDAIVDLSCCGPGAVQVPWCLLHISVEEAPDVDAEDLVSPEDGQPVDLAAIDRWLGRPRGEEDALEQRVAMLGRYIRMWRTGNNGEVPEEALERLTELAAGLDEAGIHPPLPCTSALISGLADDLPVPSDLLVFDESKADMP